MIKNRQYIQFLYVIFLILLNLGTIPYCGLFKENLTGLGNNLHHPLYLIIWATSASFYFLIYTRKIMKHFNYKNIIGWGFLYITCISLIIATVIPYNLKLFPIMSKWHVRFGVFGTVGYTIVLFHVLFEILPKDYTFFIKTFPYHIYLVIFDSLLFLLYGSVSALSETSFVIGMGLLLYHDIKLLNIS